MKIHHTAQRGVGGWWWSSCLGGARPGNEGQQGHVGPLPAAQTELGLWEEGGDQDDELAPSPWLREEP